MFSWFQALMPKEERFFELFWGAMRSGLFFTPVNWHLSAEEMQYVVDDCDAKVLFASARVRDAVDDVPVPTRSGRGWRRW